MYLRTEALKAGYQAELESHRTKLEDVKSKLEALYAERHDDKAFVDELKHRFDEDMKNADLEMVSFQTGTKLVKSAIVPGLVLILEHCPKVNVY